MHLTHIQITTAKPAAKPYKLSDGDALHLLIQPNGSKFWRMNYRYLGRQKTLYIGSWPEIGLSAARERRDAARRQIASGLDPSQQKRAARREAMVAHENTFGTVAEEWLAKIDREGRATVTLQKVRWLLGIAKPILGNMPLSQVTPLDVLGVLRSLEETGRYESARRMRSVISRVMRYGVATARADRDVAVDLRGALITPKVVHHAAIITSSGAGRLLGAIDSYTGRATTVMALKLMPHLFVRPGELRKAEWNEFDAEKAVWSIPAERMKMGCPHRVPLSRQVVEMLQQLHELTGDGQHLFPAMGSPGQCLSENTMNSALRRMGYGQSEMTTHGFRAMAATLLNEMGLWNPDAIERQMAHLDTSAVRRIYARGEYWDERTRMMQYWSDHLDKLREEATRPVHHPSRGFGRARQPALLTAEPA